MWQDFTDYILNEAGESDVRIAEIGVGKFDRIAERLSEKENITIIKTDILPKDESVLKDDVTNPNIDLYMDVDIIFLEQVPLQLQIH